MNVIIVILIGILVFFIIKKFISTDGGSIIQWDRGNGVDSVGLNIWDIFYVFYFIILYWEFLWFESVCNIIVPDIDYWFLRQVINKWIGI